MPSRIVTSTYRYKRPPRKRKAVPLTGPAIVRKGAAKPETAPAPADDDRKPAIVTVADLMVSDGSDTAPSANVSPRSQTAAVPPRSAIVTARRPGARPSVDVPDMTPEEHRRRGDAADALFRDIVRQATE